MTTMPLGNTDKLQTKYRLLEVTANHIARHGFESASLRRIAADAGVTAAAIYRHYPKGKADLYEATMALVSSNVAEFVLEGYRAELNAAEQVVAQCDLLWQFFSQYPNIAAMIVRENISGGPDRPSPYLNQHVEIINSIREFLDSAINNEEIQKINVSAFLFSITTYVTSFHGCLALKDVIWTAQDLEQAHQEFLDNVRSKLNLQAGASQDE